MFCCDKINQSKRLIYIHDYNILILTTIAVNQIKCTASQICKKNILDKNQKHYFPSTSTE